LTRLVPYTPLRSPRVRRGTRNVRRHYAAWRRQRAETRGDQRFSRPANYDLDAKLLEYLPASGFYVEAGEYDGYSESITFFLERFRGRSGLLVEAVPELYDWAVRLRPGSSVVNCALVPPERAGEMASIYYAGTMSIIAGARGDEDGDRAYVDAAMLFDDGYEIRVPGRTLSGVLDEGGCPQIDFLSLDVEGFEEPALRGLDLNRHAPKMVLVEVHTEDHLAAVSAVLGDRYRMVDHLTPQDVLFELSQVEPHPPGAPGPRAALDPRPPSQAKTRL
jgi:FkbM family methyltransferase